MVCWSEEMPLPSSMVSQISQTHGMLFSPLPSTCQVCDELLRAVRDSSLPSTANSRKRRRTISSSGSGSGRPSDSGSSLWPFMWGWGSKGAVHEHGHQQREQRDVQYAEAYAIEGACGMQQQAGSMLMQNAGMCGDEDPKQAVQPATPVHTSTDGTSNTAGTKATTATTNDEAMRSHSLRECQPQGACVGHRPGKLQRVRPQAIGIALEQVATGGGGTVDAAGVADSHSPGVLVGGVVQAHAHSAAGTDSERQGQGQAGGLGGSSGSSSRSWYAWLQQWRGQL